MANLPTRAVFKAEDYKADEIRVIIAVDAIVAAEFITGGWDRIDDAGDAYEDRVAFVFEPKYADLVALVVERTQGAIH